MTVFTMVMFMVDEDCMALLPANEYAAKGLKKLTPGCSVLVELGAETRARAELRKFVFAVISKLARALNIQGEGAERTEKLRIMLLMRTGRCHLVPVPVTDTASGKKVERYVAVVESMARQLMDEDELRAFWADARRVVIEQLLPEIADEVARDDIMQMIADRS